MQNALSDAEPNQATWQDKLDSTVERIAALYAGEIGRKKAEMVTVSLQFNLYCIILGSKEEQGAQDGLRSPRAGLYVGQCLR